MYRTKVGVDLSVDKRGGAEPEGSPPIFNH
jgi:hypothetical protein